MIQFTAYGVPAPKGSTKAFMPKGARFPVITSDCKRTKPWAETVKWAAVNAIKGDLIPYPDQAIELALWFAMPRPKSLPKKVTEHMKKPDLDKLVRAVKDALTGIVWGDDSQVVALKAFKDYAEGRTGVVISVKAKGE